MLVAVCGLVVTCSIADANAAGIRTALTPTLMAPTLTTVAAPTRTSTTPASTTPTTPTSTTPTPPTPTTPTNTTETTRAAPLHDECELAVRLKEGGERALARKEYLRVLEADPTLTCAIDGLKEINAKKLVDPQPCVGADKEASDGDFLAARRKYEELAAQGASCATGGLAAIEKVEALCVRGDAFAEAGDEATALTAYRDALKENPNAACAKEGVDAGGGAGGVRDDLEDGIDDAIKAATAAVEVLAILALIGVVVLLLGHVPVLRRFIHALPWARTILSPRFAITALDDKGSGVEVGAAVTARMKQHLQQMQDQALTQADDYDMDLAGTTERFVAQVSGDGRVQRALDAAGGISDHTKAVTAILDFVVALLPVTRFSVNGTLEPPGPNGVGITVVLEIDGVIRGATRLQGPLAGDQATGDDYLRLADAAAVWVQYEVAYALLRQPLAGGAAESYALTRKAIDLEGDGESELARAAFADAFSLDRRNWTARINLNRFEVRGADDPDARVRAVRLTAETLQALEEDARARTSRTVPDWWLPRLWRGLADWITTLWHRVVDWSDGQEDPRRAAPWAFDPNAYRLAYLLVAQQVNAEIDGMEIGAPDSLSVEGLGRETRDLALTVLAWQEARNRRRWQRLGFRRDLSSQDRRLERFLDGTVVPCLNLAITGHRAVRGGQRELVREVVDRYARDHDALSYRGLYNLACLLASTTWDGRNAIEPDEVEAVDEERLRFALHVLRQALRRPEGRHRMLLARSARKDPSLMLLRASDATKREFDALVAVAGGLGALEDEDWIGAKAWRWIRERARGTSGDTGRPAEPEA